MRLPVLAIETHIRRLSGSVDYLWSAAWWWSARCWIAERRLSKALDQYGENSLEVRRCTLRYQELYFGVRYWRTAPPLVRRAIEAAESKGVPRADLRLLALNRDVRQLDDRIFVRRSWWMPVFAYAAPVVMACNWAYLMAFALVSPGPWFAKTLTAFVITSLYWLMWPGFGLYTTRAYAAVKRSGARVQETGRSMIASARIHTMSDNSGA